MFTQLEHLPNELFYIIFTYLNGLDLYLAFSNLNTRIHRLLDDVASHQSLDLTSGSVSYNAFRAYIADRYSVRSSFISSLKFDCLSLSPFGIKDLFSSLINTSINNRLQRLTLITSEFASVTTTDIVTLLEQMMIANKQGCGRLEHLTLKFECFDDYYLKILIMIIQRNISFDTMILDVTKYIVRPALARYDAASSNETNLHIAIDTRPLLRNIIHLSLSLEYCSDLVLLLQHGILPLLQHLNVVFERQNSHIDSRPFRFKVDELNLFTTDTTRLRILSLCNLHMHYALRFVRFLRLTQLQTLRLINISDSTLRRITRFERVISVRLYNLITLQFVLCFPINNDLYNNKSYCSEDYAILQNELWQSRGWHARDYIDTDQKRFIIYTVPYPLSYDRSLRNHIFIAAQQPDFVDLKTYQLLSWICTNPDPSAIAQSLNGLSEARHLHWIFDARVSPLLLPSSNNIDFVTRWSPMQLRSLWLFMNLQISIEDRANIITRMLFVCPRLHTLIVGSKELAQCLEQKPQVILSSLDHLHLYLDRVHEMVDPVYLAAVFPNISCLSTGKEYLAMDIKLGHVVLNLIKALPYLRRLRFNEHDFSYNRDTDQSDNNLLVQMLQNSEQLRSVDCCVRVFERCHLTIWL